MAARLSLIACALLCLSPSAPLSAASWAARGHAKRGGHTPSNATPSFNGVRAAASHTGIMSAATLMPESDDFASGNSISAEGGTAGLKLDPGVAYDNTYKVQYFVTATINGHPSQYGSADLVIAIETNDGSGWVERGTYYYNCGYLSGPPPYSTRSCTWSGEQQAITVAGLGLGDSIRLKAKSFTPPSNGAGASFWIGGGDGVGVNHGVIYMTDMTVSVVASVDTPAPRADNNTGFTAGFTITNAGAGTDSYTLTCSVQNITCTGVSPSSVSNLTPGGSAPVTVTYNTNAVAWGSLQLTATGGSGNAGHGVIEVPVVPYTVAVTPDAKNVGVLASASRTQPFTVQNVTSAPVTYTFPVLCTGTAVSNCSQPASQSIPAASSTTINVSFNSSATIGATGRIRLQASGTPGQDSGWVTVTVGSQMAPDAVDNSNTMPGLRVEPSICVTVAASRGAAYQCGDLRIVHALPTTRTLNKARTPTLIYNSQHAHPYALVAANVSLNAAAATPDSVVATLRLSNVVHGRSRWDGADWIPGRASRIVIADTTLTRALPRKDTIYSFVLGVVNYYGSIPTAEVTTTSKFAVVDRSVSPFGTGWWLAGLEHLDIGTMTWTAGDGALRQYASAGTNVWAASTLDHPDTLKFDGTYYVRLLAHGDTVKFDAQGRHVATVTRLGHQTTFAYDSCSRLLSIILPPTGSGRVYQFTYASPTDCTTTLQSVTAPPLGGSARVTTLTVVNRRVTAIRDPDNTTVAFGYGTGPDTNRIVSRTDRRGTVTSFTYDAGKRLARASIAMGTGAALTMKWRAVQSYGLPNTGTPSAIDTAVAYTRLDGPRVDVADTTLFWESKFFTPYRIVNALGYETKLSHDDSRWRALVTHLVYPNGRALGAVYDDRGNLLTVTDSSVFQNGKYATTRYVWNRKWDFDSIVAPPEGDSTVISYDATNGNRVWQQPGSNQSRRVTFSYDATCKLLASTQYPVPTGDPASIDHITYDATTCNVTGTETPRGYWTNYFKDAVGRDTIVAAVVDSSDHSNCTLPCTTWQRQQFLYDLTDRVTLTQTIGPHGSSFDTLTVQNYYNPESLRDSLWRKSAPDSNAIGWIATRWRYDAAGRKVQEIAPDGQKDSTIYDPASNVTSYRSRRGYTTTMTYDPLNHLARRVMPQVDYAQSSKTSGTFPRYPNNGTGLRIYQDTQIFAYDPMGNLVQADNRDARVKRTYNLNGTVVTDTLRITAYVDTTDFTSHSYGLQFGYDLDGRRTWVQHPANLRSSSGKDTTRYTYDASTSELVTVRDPLGYSYGLTYTPAGQLATVSYPGGLIEIDRYDPDGNLRKRIELNKSVHAPPYDYTTDSLRVDSLVWRDARGKPLKVVNGGWQRDTAYYTYNGLGALLTSWNFKRFQAPPYGWYTETISESFTPDALGNAHHASMLSYQADDQGHSTTIQSTNDLLVYYPDGTGRLKDKTADHEHYDVGGNIEWHEMIVGTQSSDAVSYFGAGEQLRVIDKRWMDAPPPPAQMTFKTHYDEYRYDALGRRVLVRSRNVCFPTPNFLTPDCMSKIRRTVWDGDQELWEIQYPGDDTVSTAGLEKDTVTVTPDGRLWGRVVYTHGHGIDQPLGVVRMGYVEPAAASPGYVQFDTIAATPHYNHRVLPDLPSFGNGAARRCVVQTDTVCVELSFPHGLSAYQQQFYRPGGWFGTVPEGKQEATGQVYLRNRYYDPTSGRFTQEDPIGLAGGVNLYGYADGDPINLSDPLGLCADDGGDDAADQGDQGDQGGDSTKAKPKPKKLSCHYQVSTGHMECQEPGGQWNVVDAYGSSGLSGGYKNNPAMESVKDHGPISVGTYNMTPMPGNYHNLGPNTIVLTPVPGPNALFGRTLLRIHGGTRSTGCILLGPNARSTIAGHGGGTLTVTP